VTTHWDFDDESDSDETDPVHSYIKSGVYDVQLDVLDDDDAKASYQLRIFIENRNPVCTINASAVEGNIQTGFVFEANASDPDGTISSYYWDLGDGNIGSMSFVEHKYKKPGEYMVRLIVEDDEGAEAKTSLIITIIDLPPVAVGEVFPTDINTQETVSFVGDESYDLEGSITYLWDFGNGNTSNAMTTKHTYMIAGNYTPTLTVFDLAGNKATIILTNVLVHNRPPSAIFRIFGNFTENGTVYFDGTKSSDPEGDISYLWDFGDDNNSSGPVVEHIFPGPGTYTVVLTVIDKDGAENTVLDHVTVVANPPPLPPPKESVESLQEDASVITNLLILNIILIVLVIVVAVWALSRRKKAAEDAAEPPQELPPPLSPEDIGYPNLQMAQQPFPQAAPYPDSQQLQAPPVQEQGYPYPFPQQEQIPPALPASDYPEVPITQEPPPPQQPVMKVEEER
jgi:PKD repeat protein